MNPLKRLDSFLDNPTQNNAFICSAQSCLSTFEKIEQKCKLLLFLLPTLSQESQRIVNFNNFRGINVSDKYAGLPTTQELFNQNFQEGDIKSLAMLQIEHLLEAIQRLREVIKSIIKDIKPEIPLYADKKTPVFSGLIAGTNIPQSINTRLGNRYVFRNNWVRNETSLPSPSIIEETRERFGTESTIWPIGSSDIIGLKIGASWYSVMYHPELEKFINEKLTSTCIPIDQIENTGSHFMQIFKCIRWLWKNASSTCFFAKETSDEWILQDLKSPMAFLERSTFRRLMTESQSITQSGVQELLSEIIPTLKIKQNNALAAFSYHFNLPPTFPIHTMVREAILFPNTLLLSTLIKSYIFTEALPGFNHVDNLFHLPEDVIILAATNPLFDVSVDTFMFGIIPLLAGFSSKVSASAFKLTTLAIMACHPLFLFPRSLLIPELRRKITSMEEREVIYNLPSIAGIRANRDVPEPPFYTFNRLSGAYEILSINFANKMTNASHSFFTGYHIFNRAAIRTIFTIESLQWLSQEKFLHLKSPDTESIGSLANIISTIVNA